MLTPDIDVRLSCCRIVIGGGTVWDMWKSDTGIFGRVGQVCISWLEIFSRYTLHICRARYCFTNSVRPSVRPSSDDNVRELIHHNVFTV